MLNIAKQVSAMERMTVDELRRKYAEVFGERTNGRHKQWLVKRITWRMQANAEGDLSERARKRALELARDADIRMMPPREPQLSGEGTTATVHAPIASDNRLPLPGTILKRQYKGRVVSVRVLSEGFEFEGERFKSLTAVARAATGTHWNGYHFFGLRKDGGKV
jgi:hypothetical protein